MKIQFQSFYYNSFDILDWELVGERRECAGSETNVGWKRTAGDCALACRGKSSMFIFGTNDFGTRRCLLPCRGCKCYCETASSSGVCDEEIDHDGFRLYKFGDNGNNLFCIILFIRKIQYTKFPYFSNIIFHLIDN